MKSIEAAQRFMDMNNNRIAKLRSEASEIHDTNLVIETQIEQMGTSIRKINHLIGE